jgi:ATP-dependent RNA helicase MSS116
MPESRDQYIHRLGRTGRGGTDGKGWLVLSDWESKFLKELKGVEIPLNEELQELIANQQISPQSRDQMEAIRRRVRAGDQVLTGSATGAYQAFLGYYLGQMKRMGMNRKEELVDIANDFASLAGLSGPPELSRDLIGKMGLKGVGGINIGGGRDSYNSDRNGGSQGHRNSRQGHEDGRRPQRNSSGGDRRR